MAPVTPKKASGDAQSPDRGNIIEGKRVRKPNQMYTKDYVVNMVIDALLDLPDGFDDAEAAGIADLVWKSDFSEDEPLTVMQIRLGAALKTQYKEDVEKATLKEITSIIRNKTWGYLMNLGDREVSTHTAVLPCDVLVKDKRDSLGALLLYKSRLAVGGNYVLEDGYSPFDKTSPTATIDAVYAFLAVAQRWKMQVEVGDVPTAYLHALIPSGRKHCMRISKLIAKYVLQVDPGAEPYLQPDGSLLVELQRALYGLPESGKLWHECICEKLRSIGYKQKDGDSCQWSYIERNSVTHKIISMSFILIYVDDILHIYGGQQGGEKVRARLHEKLHKAGLPKLTCHKLTPENPVSFLGLSIMILDGRRFHVSQPGYIAAMIANFPMQSGPSLKPKSSPLPSNFNSRHPEGAELKPLTEIGRKSYLKWVQTLAWTTRTRIDLCAAVAMKQTKCTAPLCIDWLDLEHMMGYLMSSPNRGIIIDCDDLTMLTLYADCGFATHDDKKSHSGHIVFGGKDRRVPLSWSSSKQKIVTSSSTEGELVALSDKADKILTMHQQMLFLLQKVVTPMTVMQDNTSTITIAYLGRPSLHSRRRFIDIRYFWFKQFLDSSTLAMHYCETAKMFADLLASIRNGSEFRAMRDVIMGSA